MTFDEICEVVAKKHGVSVQTVKTQMQQAINYAYHNPCSDKQKQAQFKVTNSNDIPTPQQVIEFICKKNKKTIDF